MEDTSGHHEPALSRVVGYEWPRRLPHADGSKGERSAKANPTFCGRGRGDRGVRGSIASGAVGRKRPRSIPRLQKSRNRGSACPMTIRRSGLGCRETPGFPGHVVRSLSLRGTSTQRKLRQRAGNARGTGTRHSDRWQKSVGRIARLVRREVERLVGAAQDASQEEARSTA
jgi:hypothetical protein